MLVVMGGLGEVWPHTLQLPCLMAPYETAFKSLVSRAVLDLGQLKVYSAAVKTSVQ